MAKKKAKTLARVAQAMSLIKNGKPNRSGKSKEERRLRKLEQRRKEKAKITPHQWAQPAPAHLRGELERPQVKSKYKTVYEIMENKDRKKPLESSVTKDPNPPPGYAFVPVGDPLMTNKCKELSRDRDAMIFIVSTSQEGVSEISEHMHRLGYHFREAIVEDARALLGETVVVPVVPGQVEPIPESQEEINKQADAAIRDLFPRIPNPDRAMILEHAFKKGALFHGEKTVGLQSDIPLSRRVQLAVLAHIRHTHTRYDQLLKETSWQNARKVVEPICLRIIVEWRGDDENGRDLEEDIVREVVMLTESEDEEEDDDSSEDDTDEDGEFASESSPELLPITSTVQNKSVQRMDDRSQVLVSQNSNQGFSEVQNGIASRTRSQAQRNSKQDRRGFHRFQTALDKARGSLNSYQNPIAARSSSDSRNLQTAQASTRSAQRSPDRSNLVPAFYEPGRPTPHYSQHRQIPVMTTPNNEVDLGLYEQHTYRGKPIQPGHDTHHALEQRPSQVVRGSPQKHSLQDMLVPSIESPPSDAMISTAHIHARHNAPIRIERPPESYPRMRPDASRASPPRRQVIVVGDDSPHAKRQRLVHKDDYDDFRPIPSPDHNIRVMSPHRASHFMRPSSVQREDLPIKRSIVYLGSREDASREVGTSFHPPRSIPVYDTPDSGSLTRPPEHYRREVVESDHRGEPRLVRQLDHSMPAREYIGEPYHRRQVQPFEDGRNIQHIGMSEQRRGQRLVDTEHRIVLPLSPTFQPANSVSRSYDTGYRPAFVEQDLAREMSQSQLVDPIPRPREHFIFSEKPLSTLERESFRRYEDDSARQPGTMSYPRERSPVRYADRPIYREDVRQPEGHQRRVPTSQCHNRPQEPASFPRLAPPIQEPMYSRAPQPRQIITLE